MRRMTAVVLGTAMLAGVAALVALNAKAQEPIATDVSVNANRNMTSIQMANGIAYQCVRDHLPVPQDDPQQHTLERGC